jgi:hypothetical protein
MQQWFNSLARLFLECSGGALAGRKNQEKVKLAQLWHRFDQQPLAEQSTVMQLAQAMFRETWLEGGISRMARMANSDQSNQPN